MSAAWPESDTTTGLASRRPHRSTRPRLEVVRTSDELSSVVLVEVSPSPHDAVIASLREHIAVLATRYAEDVASLEQRLEVRRQEADQAWRIADAAQTRARALNGRVAALEQALQLAEATVADAQARAERLEEAARLPWWAIKRRRALIDLA